MRGGWLVVIGILLAAWQQYFVEAAIVAVCMLVLIEWQRRRSQRCRTEGCVAAAEHFTFCRLCWRRIPPNRRAAIQYAYQFFRGESNLIHEDLAATYHEDSGQPAGWTAEGESPVWRS